MVGGDRDQRGVKLEHRDATQQRQRQRQDANVERGQAPADRPGAGIERVHHRSICLSVCAGDRGIVSILSILSKIGSLCA